MHALETFKNPAGQGHEPAEDSAEFDTIRSPRSYFAEAANLVANGAALFAGRYVLEELLGKGGMGCVYRARHYLLGHTFALKLLHGALVASPKMRARFAQEAEIAGRLEHPNLVSVVYAGETGEGQPYLVMEYIEGRSLAESIRAEAPFSSRRVVDLMKQLCLGLAYAHERGLVHRDLKPKNVLVSADAGREAVHIVDFGLAMSLDPEEFARITAAGCVMGSPRYMAPEQASGAELDHRTDLFALGLLMYQMLSGVHPFEGHAIEVVRKNLSTPPPRIAERCPGLEVDPTLEAIAFKLMAKNPAGRYQSAREVTRALTYWEGFADAGGPGRAEILPVGSEPAPERRLSAAASALRRWFGRWGLWLLGAAQVALVVGLSLSSLTVPGAGGDGALASDAPARGSNASHAAELAADDAEGGPPDLGRLGREDASMRPAASPVDVAGPALRAPRRRALLAVESTRTPAPAACAPRCRINADAGAGTRGRVKPPGDVARYPS